MSKIKFECETTRAQYKAIKKFDHHQLNIFVDDIYKKGKFAGYDAGYQQGLKTAVEMQASVPSMEKILDAVSGVKGIGPKKLEEIKCAIEAATKEALEDEKT